MSQTALTIGETYADRYMVGTGTESDPWIIGTQPDTSYDVQNFLDTIYTPEAYVKLARDIDFSKDLTYREGIDHVIVIDVARLCADEKTKVSGINATASSLFSAGTSCEHTIERIQFLSMLHRGEYPVVYGSSSTSYGINFIECDFSVLKAKDSAHAFSAYALHFDHCSIYLDASLAVTSNFTVFNTSSAYEYCSIYYKGAVGGTSSQYLIKNGNHVGITGDVSARSGGTSILLFTSCKYCYFAGSAEGTGRDIYIGSWSYGGCVECLTCVTEVKGDYVVTPFTDATTIIVTPEQLRDRDYLYSIGFLP